MPSHLNSLQLGLIRLSRIVFEIRQLDHIFVQVSKAHRQRIDFRMQFREQNSKILGVAPGKFFRHGEMLLIKTFLKVCHPERSEGSAVFSAPPKRSSDSRPESQPPLSPAS